MMPAMHSLQPNPGLGSDFFFSLFRILLLAGVQLKLCETGEAPATCSRRRGEEGNIVAISQTHMVDPSDACVVRGYFRGAGVAEWRTRLTLFTNERRDVGFFFFFFQYAVFYTFIQSNI